MGKLALVDGDIIVYSVGFAAQGDPLDHALHSVKVMLADIVDKSGSDDYQVFLTGDNNFRKEVAVCLPYKGNRKTEKPEHYDAIRDYLIDHHHAVVTEGIEADDALGIIQLNPPENTSTVICTIDKDLDMIQGEHYCWRGKKKGTYHIGEIEANRNFYKQMIQGDSADNIPGLFKYCGSKATKKLLDRIDMRITPVGMYREVFDIYHKCRSKGYQSKHIANYVDVEPFLLEIGKLLWMQREVGEDWTPPTE